MCAMVLTPLTHHGRNQASHKTEFESQKKEMEERFNEGTSLRPCSLLPYTLERSLPLRFSAELALISHSSVGMEKETAQLKENNKVGIKWCRTVGHLAI